MTYLSTVLADAPVHYWRMADPGGALAFDIGSSPFPLFQSAAFETFPYSGISLSGGSALFPGNINMASVDSLPAAANPWTLEAWVWQLARTGLGTQQLVGWNATTVGIGIGIDGTGHPQSNGGLNVVAPNPISVHAWHHIVGTGDGVNQRIYVDGLLGASTGTAGPVGWTAGLGVGSTGGSTLFSRAFIAEVAYYNVALSAARILAHFAAQESSAGPTYKGNGSFSPSSGAVTLDADQLASILAAVRKTY